MVIDCKGICLDIFSNFVYFGHAIVMPILKK